MQKINKKGVIKTLKNQYVASVNVCGRNGYLFTPAAINHELLWNKAIKKQLKTSGVPVEFNFDGKASNYDEVNMVNVAGFIRKLKLNKNGNLIADIDIINTPTGKIVLNCISNVIIGINGWADTEVIKDPNKQATCKRVIKFRFTKFTFDQWITGIAKSKQ